MNRYFKVIEIDADTFIDAVGEDLDCLQLAVPVGNDVFVAVADTEDEISIYLDCFCEGEK